MYRQSITWSPWVGRPKMLTYRKRITFFLILLFLIEKSWPYRRSRMVGKKEVSRRNCKKIIFFWFQLRKIMLNSEKTSNTLQQSQGRASVTSLLRLIPHYGTFLKILSSWAAKLASLVKSAGESRTRLRKMMPLGIWFNSPLTPRTVMVLKLCNT